MPGGLMNLVSQGQQNIILNGNPSKSFFKTTYSKYTNFGLQKFRVDFEGAKTLRMTEESTFTFKIPRYADLLMDTYLSVALPNIWSPIMPPQQRTAESIATGEANVGKWIPYEFKWIENLGAKMISKVTITCGNQLLQEFSGNYILATIQRDYNADKTALFNKMTGNIPELNDPANSGARVNSYPNAFYTDNVAGPEPSLRGRTLYIPLNAWFNLKTQMAFPLVALQYNELYINVTFRPVNQLFVIRDVFDSINNYPYVAPNFNVFYMQFYRFLQPPPDLNLSIDSYTDTRTAWNADINLQCTYCFLSNEESRYFATNEQKYLFKQVHETSYYNVTGSNKIDLKSIGMVANWLFYFQRSDVNLRNEWSNYTNWPYNYIPNDLIQAPTDGNFPVQRMYDGNDGSATEIVPIGPGVNVNGQLTGWMLTGLYNIQNEKNILVNMGILLDGSYRENTQPVGIFNYVEKFNRTAGNAPDGLFCYNFCTDTSPYNLQPSGAINMSRFNQIEFEFNTIYPPFDPLAQTMSICDPQTGAIIGNNKNSWNIYEYNYNLYVMEERLNMVIFIGGNCGLMYAT
jgi:hypothetical protein